MNLENTTGTLNGVAPDVAADTDEPKDIIEGLVEELIGKFGIGLSEILAIAGTAAGVYFAYTVLRGALDQRRGRRNAEGEQAIRLARYAQKRADGKISHRIDAVLILGAEAIKQASIDASNREAWARLAEIRRRLSI